MIVHNGDQWFLMNVYSFHFQFIIMSVAADWCSILKIEHTWSYQFGILCLRRLLRLLWSSQRKAGQICIDVPTDICSPI